MPPVPLNPECLTAIIERAVCHGAGCGEITLRQLSLSQIQSSQHPRLAPLQHVAIGLLVKLRLPRAMHLLFNIHAIDHLADGVAQADWIFFELDQLLEEILSQHKPLRHVVMHCGYAYRFHLLEP